MTLLKFSEKSSNKILKLHIYFTFVIVKKFYFYFSPSKFFFLDPPCFGHVCHEELVFWVNMTRILPSSKQGSVESMICLIVSLNLVRI